MTPEEMKQQMQKNLERLKTLRDEIRVDIHLAGMDAKDAWRELEPRFGDVQRFADDVSEVSRKAIAELAEKFESFRKSLKRHGDQPRA